MQITDRRFFIWALAVVAMARLFGMAAMPLMDTSEPRYAEIARIMAETGDWITPWFEPGAPFWGKPPLSFWAQALGIKLLGVSEFAVRLPSFIVMAMLLLLIYQAADINSGRRTAQLAALIFSTMLLPLVSAGAVLTDPFLALGVTLSMLAFYVAPLCPTWFWRYGFFVGIVIGLLSKGPLAVALIGVAIIPWLVFQADWRDRLRALPWISGSTLVVALSLPWYIAAEIKTPGFLQYFIVGEHFLRFVDGGWSGDLYGTAHERPLGSIWFELVVASSPWGPVGLVALLYFMLPRRRVKLIRFVRQPGVAYLLAWAVAAPVFFTLSRNILWTYVLPSLPAVAMILACVVEPSIDEWKSKGRFYVVILAFSLVPIASIALGVVSLTNPNRLKTERELLATAAEEMQKGKTLYFVGSRPFSARFYSYGRAKLISRQELGAWLQTRPRALIAVPKGSNFSLLESPSQRLRPLFESRRYVLYDLNVTVSESVQ